MAFPQINHSILEATFKGTSHTTNEGTAIHSFRGVPYARISARFEYAQLIDKYVGGVVNATTYGYVHSHVLIRIETTDLPPFYFAVHDVRKYTSTCVIYCGFRRTLR